MTNILIQAILLGGYYALIACGLAFMFQVMRVINLAHGEFMMMGGYATITAVGLGVNVFVAMLVIAPLVVGLIGLVVERLVIRHLYGRLVDTMLATWGLSLVFIGLATMIFGNTTTGISTPIAGFTVGNYQINGYNFFIILVSIALVIGIYAVLRGTRAGLIAQEKRGRVKWCKLQPDAMRAASVWMQGFGQFEPVNLDAFERFLASELPEADQP